MLWLVPFMIFFTGLSFFSWGSLRYWLLSNAVKCRVIVDDSVTAKTEQIFAPLGNPVVCNRCYLGGFLQWWIQDFKKGGSNRYIARPYLIAAQHFFVIHAITSYLVHTCIYYKLLFA